MTGSGKVMARHAGKQHFNEKMTRDEIRCLGMGLGHSTLQHLSVKERGRSDIPPMATMGSSCQHGEQQSVDSGGPSRGPTSAFWKGGDGEPPGRRLEAPWRGAHEGACPSMPGCC